MSDQNKIDNLNKALNQASWTKTLPNNEVLEYNAEEHWYSITRFVDGEEYVEKVMIPEVESEDGIIKYQDIDFFTLGKFEIVE